MTLPSEVLKVPPWHGQYIVEELSYLHSAGPVGAGRAERFPRPVQVQKNRTSKRGVVEIRVVLAI